MMQQSLFDDGIDYATVRPIDGPLVERHVCRNCKKSKPAWEYGRRRVKLPSGKVKRYRKTECKECLAGREKARRAQKNDAESP